MDVPSESAQLRELLEYFSLVQHVHVPTHEKGHTLDLIITLSSNQILSSDPAADELFSDHFSISFSLSLLKGDLEVKEVTIRSKKIDIKLFLDDLASTELCQNPSDDLMLSWIVTIIRYLAYTNNMLHLERSPYSFAGNTHGLTKPPRSLNM